jgi:threonylcarbamoyladenosine tRNA methylthiotransferase MtaB
MIRNNPEALVVVTGCYAQTSSDEVMAIEGVDLVVGTQDRARIVDLVEMAGQQSGPINAVRDVFKNTKFEELPAPVVTERVRAFLKIQEGCSNYCAYCIVPYARGPLKSRAFEDALAEAGSLVAMGFKEIVVTGIHIGAYGQDLGEKGNLTALLDSLAKLPGLARLRVSSIEPMDITSELIEVMVAHEKICRHLHIPLQSGDDEVLKKMRRHYTVNDFRQLVRAIRRKIPDLALTTDVIVGFPGETDEQFYNTYRFVQEIAFARLHVFKYSPRRGTPAAEFSSQIPPPVKEERSKRLLVLGRKLAYFFALRQLGCRVQVLVEGPSGQHAGFYEGLTDDYLRVIFPFSSFNLRGELVTVLIEELQGAALKGTII